MYINSAIICITALLASVMTCNVRADFISGDMKLRDAIYLYNLDIDGDGSIGLFGFDCDVFQVVLDLDVGYADLRYNEIDYAGESLFQKYPDRLLSQHKMFSYTLYKDKNIKFFNFGDEITGTKSAIGNGTFFAYCFSTNTNAFVFQYDGNLCVNKFSDGTTSPASCD